MFDVQFLWFSIYSPDPISTSSLSVARSIAVVAYIKLSLMCTDLVSSFLYSIFPRRIAAVSHGNDSQVAESLSVQSTATMTAAGTTVIVTRRGSGDSIEDEVADDDADTKGPSAKRFLLLGNTSGFPMDDETWDRMWRNIQKINPAAKEDVERIRNSVDLPTVCSTIVHHSLWSCSE